MWIRGILWLITRHYPSNFEFNFISNITPKVAILDAGDNLLLSNLYKPWFLYCNEHNTVPIPIPAWDYNIINRCLLFDCNLLGGNEFLDESLASFPSVDKVDRDKYFTINMALPINYRWICLRLSHLRILLQD